MEPTLWQQLLLAFLLSLIRYLVPKVGDRLWRRFDSSKKGDPPTTKAAA